MNKLLKLIEKNEKDNKELKSNIEKLLKESTAPLITKIKFFVKVPNHLKNNHMYSSLIESFAPRFLKDISSGMTQRKTQIDTNNVVADTLMYHLERLAELKINPETIDEKTYNSIFVSQYDQKYPNFKEDLIIAKEILENNIGLVTHDW